MNEANGLVQLLEKALSGLSAGSEPGVLEVVLALCYSFILNCGIAGVYKWTYRGARYSQDYVHTLIILGTVVTAVIMVVSRNGATAFGMFAAFSIINFRRAESVAGHWVHIFGHGDGVSGGGAGLHVGGGCDGFECGDDQCDFEE